MVAPGDSAKGTGDVVNETNKRYYKHGRSRKM